jgi:4-oxalocrotonate tautomerase
MSQMISRLTEARVAIEGENLRPVTWVKVDEIESGDRGIGGQALTTRAVKVLTGGKTPVAAG